MSAAGTTNPNKAGTNKILINIYAGFNLISGELQSVSRQRFNTLMCVYKVISNAGLAME